MNKIVELKLKYVLDGTEIDSDKSILAVVNRFGVATEIMTKKKFRAVLDPSIRRDGIYVAEKGRLILSKKDEELNITKVNLDKFRNYVEEYKIDPEAFKKSITMIPAKELIKVKKR